MKEASGVSGRTVDGTSNGKVEQSVYLQASRYQSDLPAPSRNLSVSANTTVHDGGTALASVGQAI